ncbi:MAG TPA: SIR2 family protein [Verrucomicrobiales bacterium]|nr:SIR2 family protein [Verrucomicrobiales bacterium]
MQKNVEFESNLALDELVRLRGSSERPLVFWIGAGVSSWAGIKRWDELAQTMRSEFLRTESTFEKELSWQWLDQKAFPSLFGHCDKVSPTRYRRILDRELNQKSPHQPVYDRFLVAMRRLTPCKILTTNADELLEQALGLRAIQPSALELVPDLLSGTGGFVGKLHGSIGDPNSLIFTDYEYAQLLERRPFLNALSRVFQAAHVVFIGYGLADDYILNLLNEANNLKTIFGDGPHFACLPWDHTHLPSSVKTIRYLPEPHKDHRSVIMILEELGAQRSPGIAFASFEMPG